MSYDGYRCKAAFPNNQPARHSPTHPNGTSHHNRYHSPMRRISSFVLVFLLVLRGLLGDAMALGVVPMTSGSGASAHGSAEVHVLTAEEHHHGDSSAQTSSGLHVGHCADAAGASSHDCGGGDSGHAVVCSACDICHSSMFASHLQASVHAAGPQVLHSRLGAAFVDAHAAQVVKPPIS